MRKYKIVIVLILLFTFTFVNASSWNNKAEDYNKGLVIEDRWGNQFVWVPIIPGTNDYKAYDNIYSKNEDMSFTDTSTKYSGYWVSRYEAGSNGTNAVSKRYVSPWSNITYLDAKKASENFSNSNGIDYGKSWKSGLMTGKAWDTMMKWIESGGRNINDSSAWGNYNNSVFPANVSGFGNKQNTAFSEVWKAKNLYDLAGNLNEFTYEVKNNSSVIRGGAYTISGSSLSAFSRSEVSNSSASDNIGFRMQLYLDSKIAPKTDLTNNGNSAGVAIMPPKLYGMKPVKVVGNNLQVTSETDKDWYKYVNQTGDTGLSHWANAQTNDGSLFVWIPRYAYKVTNGSPAGKIDIIFVDLNDKDVNGAAIPTGYSVHPAFNLPDGKISGLWVGKYESSNNGGKIQIKPNVSSWRSIKVANVFDKCYDMQNDASYGFVGLKEGSTHMTKNLDWGAITYLTHSNYGRAGQEVTKNNNASYKTGIAGQNVISGSSLSATNTWNTAKGMKASSTNNITGIYDLNGGSWEYTATNYNWNLKKAGSATKFDQLFKAKNTKYFDVYTDDKAKPGDALYETSGWHGDINKFFSAKLPWLTRGGYQLMADARCGIFAYQSGSNGNAFDNSGFRVCIFAY